MTPACGGAGFWRRRADVVVIGTGVAGLTAALAAQRGRRRVVVLSKSGHTATRYAQGGIAVVLPGTDDSVEAHVADTVTAGAGLTDPAAVRSIVDPAVWERRSAASLEQAKLFDWDRSADILYEVMRRVATKARPEDAKR